MYLETKGEVIQDLILLDSGVQLGQKVPKTESMQLALDHVQASPHKNAIQELISKKLTSEQINMSQ